MSKLAEKFLFIAIVVVVSLPLSYGGLWLHARMLKMVGVCE